MRARLGAACLAIDVFQSANWVRVGACKRPGAWCVVRGAWWSVVGGWWFTLQKVTYTYCKRPRTVLAVLAAAAVAAPCRQHLAALPYKRTHTHRQGKGGGQHTGCNFIATQRKDECWLPTACKCCRTTQQQQRRARSARTACKCYRATRV